MSKITGITYTDSELLDIIETIQHGGINGWAHVASAEYVGVGDDRRASVLVIVPSEGEWGMHADGEEKKPKVIGPNAVADAIEKIVTGRVLLNGRVRDWIASGDVGQIDGEAADCIAQVAAFGTLVYG